MVGTSRIEESDAGSIMSTRHVAALALVGWYLMTPPLESMKCSTNADHGLANEWAGPAINNAKPRLSLKRPFDSGNECRTRKSSNVRRIENARFLMIAIARLSQTERQISKVNCALRSASRPTIRASRKSKMSLEILCPVRIPTKYGE